MSSDKDLHSELTRDAARYDLPELRTPLARFTFLLGHDDCEQLFDTGHS